MSELHTWWNEYTNEHFWLEVTDRADIGVNLKAPQKNETGGDFWSYSLLTQVQPSDVVFHYDREIHAIVGKSTTVGGYWEDKLVWAARGTYAREAGIEPHLRDGWYVGLEEHVRFQHPITLDTIRERQAEITAGITDLEGRVGPPTYFPFERGERRPLRPLQGYLFKLPRFFVKMFDELGEAASSAGYAAPEERRFEPRLGAEYRPAGEDTSVAERDPFKADPAIIERGIRGHAKTQNALAEYLRGHGVEPRSPKSPEPNFDLGWEFAGQPWVAEVKSITDSNEEKQLRLGLGQVLRYRDLISQIRGATVRGVLVSESAPRDSSWLELCRQLDVDLVWPGAFENLRKRL